MARTIDPEKLADPSSLSTDDLQYAVERNLLSPDHMAEYGPQVLQAPEAPNWGDRPNTGDAGTVQDQEEGLSDDGRTVVGNEEPGDPSDYDDLTNEELRAELEERELSQSGNKKELIARLVADDNEG